MIYSSFRVIMMLSIILGVLITSSHIASSNELIITNPKKSEQDHRFDYSLFLLTEAMKRTVDRYGPYQIERYPKAISRKRALKRLFNAKITVYSAPTRPEWEASAIPIRIPLRKGILGYKIFLIREGDQGLFSQINSLDDLLKYRLGQGSQWSSTQALKRLNIKTIGGTKYEPLFKMLVNNRFDYFPRGVNEIYQEFEDRKDEFPNLKIEENLAMYLPLPTYFFVTPDRPDLAKRIEIGLLSMIDDGTLDILFHQFHDAYLKKAALKSRKIFELKNMNLTDQTPFHKSEFWYKP